jgi:hypothetical protein
MMVWNLIVWNQRDFVAFHYEDEGMKCVNGNELDGGEAGMGGRFELLELLEEKLLRSKCLLTETL